MDAEGLAPDGFPNFHTHRLKSGQALLWNIYAEQDHLDRLREQFGKALTPPPLEVGEKLQGFWKRFYQPPGGGKHSQSNALDLFGRSVLVLSPLLELDRLFLNKRENTRPNTNKKEDDREDEDFLAQYLDDDKVEEETKPASKKSGTLLLRAWTNGRFPNDDNDIRTFAAFVLAANRFAQETMERAQPDMLASYHTHLVKSDGLESAFGQRRYNLSLADLVAEFTLNAHIDQPNVRFSFKEENLKRINSPGSGVWRAKYPRGYDYGSGFCEANNYYPSSLEELETLRNRCYVQVLLRLGSMYEFRDGHTVNRGITLEVCSIGELVSVVV